MVQKFACAAILVATLVPPARAAQTAPRAPQPTCIRGVTIGRSAETGSAVTLLLREGRIEALLDAAAPVPPGYRIVEGAGLFCLPAFVDAYTRTGCATPEPAKDQDLPVDTSADVGIDMRQANRKGIEPAFRAALALAFDPKDSKTWREAGFGAALVAPTGQILAGTSCVAVTREAAARDAVLVADAFAHAAFAASGEGYPSTMMGYVAQLRQFLLDSLRHVELVRRAEERRPGLRPPFDRELEAGAELLAGKRRLLCEADQAVDIQRWIALADEFGLTIGIVGGREAWRVAPELARRDIPVLLTLDFGPEPKDPAKPAAKKRDAPAAKPETSGEETPDVAAEEEEAPPEEAPAEEAPAEQTPPEEPPAEEAADAAPPEKPEEPEVVWEYEEPLAVRRERRRLWEEGRDCARVLREAGVRFAFGTAGEKPAKLLEKVRSLVEAGLSAEAALAALGEGAAEILGVSDHLGKVAVGSDATLALWTADPLVDAKAKTRWLFVDGYPSEFREEKEKAGKPAEGVNPSGLWSLEIQADEGPISGDLTLEMDEDGATRGKLETQNPIDKSDLTVDLVGKLAGTTLELNGTLDLGGFKVDLTLTLEVEGDTLTGQAAVLPPGQDTPDIQRVSGSRVPKEGRSAR